MARNISISVSVQDQYSQSISSMREKTVAFNKDIEELSAKIKSLNKEKISLNIDAVKAQQTLRDLQQQFKNTGNAADQMVLQLANANYSNVNKQIERISKSSQQAKRELSNLVIEYSKADNRAGMFGNNSTLSNTVIHGRTGERFQNFGSGERSQSNVNDYASIGADIGMATAEAAISAKAGGAIASTVSAAMGTAFLPVVGTVLGGLAGAVIGGGIGALIDKFSGDKSKDDDIKKEFKNYAIDKYNDVLEKRNEELIEGSSMAGNFQTNSNRMRFFLGNSADTYLDKVNRQTDSPYTKNEQLGLYYALHNNAVDAQETSKAVEMLQSIGEGASLTADELTSIALTLSDMQKADQATIEMIDSFQNGSVDVYQELANEKGITSEQARLQVQNGQISGQEASEAVLNAMYGATANEGLSTYEQKALTWENSLKSLNEAEGEGYNSEREAQLEQNISWFEEHKQELLNYKKEIGRGKAQLDNALDQHMIEQMDAFLKDPYKNETDGLYDENSDLDRRLILENNWYMIGIKRQEEFAKSEEGMSLYNANANLAQSVVENSIVTFTQDIYAMESIFSESVSNTLDRVKTYANAILADAIEKNNMSVNMNNLGDINAAIENGDLQKNGYSQNVLGKYIDKYDSYTFGHNAGGSSAMYRAKRNSGIPGSSMYASTAFGLERVPYDNYPTLLHQGEQVLTAQQVRQQKNIPSVTVTGNQFVIREEADITKVAKAFVAEMQKAYAIT